MRDPTTACNHHPSPCSWATNEYGYYVTRNQRQVLEVLCQRRKVDSAVSLPAHPLVGQALVHASLAAMFSKAAEQAAVGQLL